MQFALNICFVKCFGVGGWGGWQRTKMKKVSNWFLMSNQPCRSYHSELEMKHLKYSFLHRKWFLHMHAFCLLIAMGALNHRADVRFVLWRTDGEHGETGAWSLHGPDQHADLTAGHCQRGQNHTRCWKWKAAYGCRSTAAATEWPQAGLSGEERRYLKGVVRRRVQSGRECS